jgi:hypothetical protein
MFIASSFLKRDFDKVNVFGHDLTNYAEIPMCYVGMKISIWKKIMGENGIENDLLKYASHSSKEWLQAWGCDQQILTSKLKIFGFDNINFIPRGRDINNQYLPLGRWDRFNWQKPSHQIHDVHLMRDPLNKQNFNKILEMCKFIYPEQSWNWLTDYRTEFLPHIGEVSF